MKKKNLSGPAVFMYSAILLTACMAGFLFFLYYSGAFQNGAVLWSAVVSFMILYHFGLRIFMGTITSKLKIDYRHPWYKTRKFEKGLYRFLKVRSWKDKVLTFEPDKYDFKNRTLDELATTMSKSELDHWINELISLFSLLFILLWGCAPAFLISAFFAMLFDAQFIIVQRYNRPIVLRLINAKERKRQRATACN